MKFVKWSLPLLLSAALWAQTAPSTQTATDKTATTKTTTAAKPAVKKAVKPVAKKVAAKPEPSQLAAEIDALRRAVADQQQAMEAQKQALAAQIQQLQQQLQSRDQSIAAAQQTAQQAQTTSTQVAAKVAGLDQLQSDVKDVKLNATNTATQVLDEQKRVSTLESVVSRFRFSGDVRVRQEDFLQSTAACATCTPRVRERIRVRFGIEGKASEDFVGGLALATGTIYDPTSSNDTLTSAFERKNFTLDRGYITYAPKAHPWLQLTGGKFAYTWIRTNQTFDPDINPEGFSEKLSFDIKGKSPLKNVTFTGLQLLFNEVSAPTAASASSCVANSTQIFCSNGGNLKGADSFAAGGQASAKLQLAKWFTITPSYTILNWRNENALLNEPLTVSSSSGAVAVTTVVTQGPPVAVAIAPTSAAFAPNGLTNGTISVGTTATGMAVRNFASKFLYSDLILDSTISTGAARWPVRVVLEYLNNLNAAAHPYVCANSSCSSTYLSNLGRQSHLYKAEAFFGQLKNKGDLQFSYGWWRQEQDSVLAAFAESDQRAPTNILQNLFTAQYQLRSNITLGGSLWVGRTLNSNLQNRVLLSTIASGTVEPYLKRMQFDIVYKF